MNTDLAFWNNIVNAWINVLPAEKRTKTQVFAEKLALKQVNSKHEPVKSLDEELFGEED